MSSEMMTLFYYEHCPYCVRVRVAAGLLLLPLKLVVLPNDDEETPIGMVGKKLVPILQTGADSFMGESLDIIDELCQRSTTILENNADDCARVSEFLTDNAMTIRKLSMPRWAQIPFEEFSTQAAINYFVAKKSQTIGSFPEAIANTDEFAKQLQNSIVANADLFTHASQNPRSIAAIVLFCGVWGVSSVKGFVWPEAAGEFMRTMSEQSGVDLLTKRAL